MKIRLTEPKKLNIGGGSATVVIPAAFFTMAELDRDDPNLRTEMFTDGTSVTIEFSGVAKGAAGGVK